MAMRKSRIIILILFAFLLLFLLWEILGWWINRDIWEAPKAVTACLLLLVLLGIFIWWGYWPRWRRRMRLIIIEEISRLLGREAELSQGLEIMAQDAPAGTRHIVLNMARELSEGKSLSAALASHSFFFGDFAVNLIKAGEDSGQVGAMLSLLTQTWQDEERNRQETRDAISYPIYLCLLVPVMTMIILYILLWAAPRFEEITRDFEGVPVFSSSIFFKSSLFFGKVWLVLTLLVIFVFGLGRLGRGLSRWVATSNKKRIGVLLLIGIPIILLLIDVCFIGFSKWNPLLFGILVTVVSISLVFGISLFLGYLWEGFWLRVGVIGYWLPIMGALMRERGLARFCRIWAGLLGGVKTLPEALRLTADALGQGPFRGLALDLAQASERGASVAETMAESRLVTRTACWMVSLGESEGRLFYLLERTARFYEIKAEYRARLLRRFLGPLGIIAAGCCVASFGILFISTLCSLIGAFL